MANILARRLQLQLLLISLAVLAVAALSVILIADAVRGAERMVLADTSGALSAAVRELDQQCAERLAVEPEWPQWPAGLLDVSLRGVSQAVLRSYPGVEGGYSHASQFLGYSFPTHNNPAAKVDVPLAELDAIRSVAEDSATRGDESGRVLRGTRDVVVIRARANPASRITAWAMKRIPGLTDPVLQRRRWLLAALVSAALLCLIGTMVTGVGLSRGVAAIKRGLQKLERNFQHRLPERNDELGEIAAAVNKMAELRLSLEAELRREDRLRAMGRLVAAVAHEIRNPLNGIRLSAQLLERRLRDSGPGDSQIGMIIEEVDRLEALLKELLVFDKTRPPLIERQPLLPAIERARNLLSPQAQQNNVRIDIDRAAAVAAWFDATQLHQVLLNLLLNSLEALPSGGRVRVDVTSSQETAEIRITDSGTALTASQQEHLFETFFTTKQDGSGLGLAVSRELIENMGGKLLYDATQPSPTFVIRLPGVADVEKDSTDRRR